MLKHICISAARRYEWLPIHITLREALRDVLDIHRLLLGLSVSVAAAAAAPVGVSRVRGVVRSSTPWRHRGLPTYVALREARRDTLDIHRLPLRLVVGIFVVPAVGVRRVLRIVRFFNARGNGRLPTHVVLRGARRYVFDIHGLLLRFGVGVCAAGVAVMRHELGTIRVRATRRHRGLSPHTALRVARRRRFGYRRLLAHLRRSNGIWLYELAPRLSFRLH